MGATVWPDGQAVLVNHKVGSCVSLDEMTQDEMDKMSPEEKARLAEAEQKALQIMKNRMNDGAKPHRHSQFALFVFIGFCVGAFFVGWLISLFMR